MKIFSLFYSKKVIFLLLSYRRHDNRWRDRNHHRNDRFDDCSCCDRLGPTIGRDDFGRRRSVQSSQVTVADTEEIALTFFVIILRCTLLLFIQDDSLNAPAQSSSYIVGFCRNKIFSYDSNLIESPLQNLYK